MENIIIIDDDFDDNLITLRAVLSENHNICIKTSFEEGFEALKRDDYSIAFIDVNFEKEGKNGLELLEWISTEKYYMDVIMISGLAGVEDAVKAVKLGAYDFIEKPFSEKRIEIVLEKLVEKRKLYKLALESHNCNIITENPRLKKVIAESQKVSQSSANVLITGESGTGKDVFAHLIHVQSRRNTNPLIKVNCSAVPESLFESEFFGYKKGAFTGAVSDRKGKFELADKGTLFLDEIADLPLAQQAKLLRIIEDREVFKVGAEDAVKVDVRVISATNKNLHEAVETGTFREDLYYRLNVINIFIPALRERKEDIPLLAAYFLMQIADTDGLPKKYFNDAALEYLMSLELKGNVRELKNLVQRAYFNSNSELICPADIAERAPLKPDERCEEKIGDNLFAVTKPLTLAKREFEKRYILSQLAKFGNNVSATALELGVLPNNLFRKIKELGIKERQ